jgi:hypothetical protein
MLVRRGATQDKQPVKGADARGERDSRNGKRGLRTTSIVHEGSRMMEQCVKLAGAARTKCSLAEKAYPRLVRGHTHVAHSCHR